MSDWDNLYAVFEEVAEARKQRQQELDLASERHRELEHWAAEVTSYVMADLYSAACWRAGAFEDTTRRSLRIEYPAHPPVEAWTRMTFLRLSCAESAVEFYSVRTPDSAPYIHLTPMTDRRRARHPRLVSRPGCVVLPLMDVSGRLSGYRLAWALPQTEPEPACTIDALVFRGFELLAGLLGADSPTTVQKIPIVDQ